MSTVITKITKGNIHTLQLALTHNEIVYNDLGTADVIKVALVSKDGATSLTLDDSDSNVTLNDPITGTVKWQLTSAQTDALPLGLYDLAVQVEYDSNVSKIEWVDENAVKIIRQLINS